MAMTIDVIVDDTDSSSFAESGKPYIVECAYQLAVEVRRLRERERVLVDSVVYVTMAQVRRWFDLEPNSEGMFEVLMSALEVDLRSALEAAKE